MDILSVKINLPVIPDYDMGEERKEVFEDGLFAIKGLSETMMHDSSWAIFDVEGENDAECLADLQRIRKEVAELIDDLDIGA